MSDMFSRPGNMLALAMVSVVLSFLAALWFAQRHLDVVDDQIAELTNNATPGAETASDARAQLRMLVTRAHAYVEGRGDRRSLVSEYEALRALEKAQLAMPRYPGESVLTDQLQEAMPPLSFAIDEIVDAVESRDVARARQLVAGRVSAAIDRVDAAFDALHDFNAAHAAERILAIRKTRDGANRLGTVLGAVSVLLAIVVTLLVIRSQRRHAHIAAERDRLLEERASEMEAFAYRVAHDLRGPLAGLALRLSASELAPPSPDEVRALHAKLKKRVKHMGEIIEGLLDFARSGRIENRGEVTSIAAVIDEVLGDVQPEAEAGGVALAVPKLSRDVHVACSAGVLASVVSNLVRNAVKYTRTVERTCRRVTVTVQPGAELVRLCVEDNGPGIARDTQAGIFRPFVRATEGRVDGIGLGLATVERLVTAHGGRVGVRSEVGAGSLFWVELPAAAAPKSANEPLIALDGGRSDEPAVPRGS